MKLTTTSILCMDLQMMKVSILRNSHLDTGLVEVLSLVIDLFSGCGEAIIGLYTRRFTIKTAVEFDASIANSYTMNHPEVEMIVDDIQNLDESNVFNTGDADVIMVVHLVKGSLWQGARIRDGLL